MASRTIYLIKRLEEASRVLLERALEDLGLTPRQYTTLSILASQGEMSSAELARRVLITPQSMSEVIIALDRKGLIQRRESEINRRVLGISLSPAGRALLEKAESRVDVFEARLFGVLQPQAHADLRAHVETVLRADRAARANPPLASAGGKRLR